ncbi:hypothetical protein BDZ97DRAFT_1877565 [Flammula alnicola]|nr:hypothetical protein BDZ97DRAFT_1877565 [Flammula alnicola]
MISKRVNYNKCTREQQALLVSAADAAQDYATNASSYAKSLTATTTRYSTWFGTYTTARYDTIVSQYSAISANNFSSYTYDCSCTTSDTYAYVDPEDFGHVYLCGAFWTAPMTGTDSKAGTIVHESSHFIRNAGGTDDYTYGQSACKFLAITNPDSAVLNADSHEYFAENVPFLN